MTNIYHMQELKEKLITHSTNVNTKHEKCSVKQETENFLINPLINILNYDTTNPNEVKYNYKFNNTLTIDCILLQNNNKKIAIKTIHKNFNITNCYKKDIENYFKYKDVEILILTNGIVWQFYINNNLIKEPLEFEINFLDKEDFPENEINLFYNLMKYNYNIDNIIKTIQQKEPLIERINNYLNNPDDDFYIFILKKFDIDYIEYEEYEEYKKLIKEILIKKTQIKHNSTKTNNNELKILTLEDNPKDFTTLKMEKLLIKDKEYNEGANLSEYFKIIINYIMTNYYDNDKNSFLKQCQNEKSYKTFFGENNLYDNNTKPLIIETLSSSERKIEFLQKIVDLTYNLKKSDFVFYMK